MSVLGHVGSHPIEIDLDLLLRTRLLVQGNSGAGKSWLLRRLGEQLFGKIPVILVDPEGEFATLRERVRGARLCPACWPRALPGVEAAA